MLRSDRHFETKIFFVIDLSSMIRLTKYIPDERLFVLIENEFPVDKMNFAERIIFPLISETE